MRANRRDGNQTEILKAIERAGYFVFNTADTKNGFPDLFVTSKSGVDCVMEIKMPGEKLTPAEEAFFLAHNGKHYIVRSAEEALAYLADLDEERTEIE